MEEVGIELVLSRWLVFEQLERRIKEMCCIDMKQNETNLEGRRVLCSCFS